MGKWSQIYTDTETDTSSSAEALKKKRKPSILKCKTGNVKKKKCKIHSRSEPEDSDGKYSRSRSRSRSNGKKTKLRGILKHDREKENRYYSSSGEDEEDEVKSWHPQDRCLVGRVPHPAGSKPGRGGGLALIVKKNLKNADSEQTKQSSGKKREGWLSRKRSY